MGAKNLPVGQEFFSSILFIIHHIEHLSKVIIGQISFQFFNFGLKTGIRTKSLVGQSVETGSVMKSHLSVFLATNHLQKIDSKFKDFGID